MEINEERSSIPLYLRIQEDILRIIANTEPGDRMPSEPALAKHLGVSRATLREAMRTFETQGLIRRRQGSGTFVTKPSKVIETGLEVLESINKIAHRIGLTVTMGEMEVRERAPTQDEIRALELSVDDRVLHLSRVMQENERPVAYLIDILPTEILSEDELNAKFSGSVLDTLLNRGDLALTSSRTEINAVGASQKIARALQIQRGDVLLLFTGYLYSESGQVVDYSFSYFLPGYFSFHVVRTVGG